MEVWTAVFNKMVKVRHTKQRLEMGERFSQQNIKKMRELGNNTTVKEGSREKEELKKNKSTAGMFQKQQEGENGWS